MTTALLFDGFAVGAANASVSVAITGQWWSLSLKPLLCSLLRLLTWPSQRRGPQWQSWQRFPRDSNGLWWFLLFVWLLTLPQPLYLKCTFCQRPVVYFWGNVHSTYFIGWGVTVITLHWSLIPEIHWCSDSSLARHLSVGYLTWQFGFNVSSPSAPLADSS